MVPYVLTIFILFKLSARIVKLVSAAPAKLIGSTCEDGAHQNRSGRKLISVFVPTAPNPTSGYYIMLPEEEIAELPITREDAFKIIMSAGLATNNVDDAVRYTKNN